MHQQGNSSGAWHQWCRWAGCWFKAGVYLVLDIQEYVSLRDFNTLGLSACARYFFELTAADDVPPLIEFAEAHQLPLLIVGGGSNIVITKDYPGLVVRMSTLGIDIEDGGDTVLVTAAAGENWHQLVARCLECGYYGIENLALIPGSVGAAPIQNIGAYGVELADVLVAVTGWDIQQKKWRQLDKEQCQLAYRDSVFKQQLNRRFVVTSVTLKLSKQAKINSSYSALQKALNDQAIVAPTPQQVAASVIALRQSKLPDPGDLPNVGSFFKNPVVNCEQAEQLRRDYPGMVQYQQERGVKLAAGWLLEQAGWKGARVADVGMHDQQALVLINYGQGSGGDVVELAEAIKRDILEKFAVHLEIEPTII